MSEDNAFWNYAIEVYGRPEVSELCLLLQERYQCSVNSLLFALWLASQGRRLTGPVTDPEILNWRQNCLQPLRKLRYQLKASGNVKPLQVECYKAMKQAELVAEKAEIVMLSELLSCYPRATAQQRLGLENLRQSVTEVNDEVEQLLVQLYDLAEESSN